MFGLVVAQVLADGTIVGLLAEVLPRDKVGGHQVVVAAFTGAEDGVQDAAHQLDSADDEPVDIVVLEFGGEGGALPAVESVFHDDGRARDRVDVQLSAPAAESAESVGLLPALLAWRYGGPVQDLLRVDHVRAELGCGGCECVGSAGVASFLVFVTGPWPASGLQKSFWKSTSTIAILFRGSDSRSEA